MKRFSIVAVSLVAAALITSLVTAPLQAQSTGPKPPITDPQLGKPKKDISSANAGADANAAGTPADTAADPAAAANTIKTMADVQACLAKGLTVYGVTSNTTNVRSAPSTDACRYGKLAKGTMVAIADFQVSKPKPLAVAPPTPDPTAAAGPTVGYVEDIQPLFVRSCSACHNAAAKTMGLQTTLYATLMAGSQNGPVVVPGNPDASKLWEMVGQGKMPATGPLPDAEKELVREWIAQGAAEHRANSAAAAPSPAAAGESTWFTLISPKLTAVKDACSDTPTEGSTLASADLIIPVSCGVEPTGAQVKTALSSGRTATSGSSATTAKASTAAAPSGGAAGTTEAKPAAAATRGASASGTGITAVALGLPAPSESDPYMVPQGFCAERRLPDNHRGITAITFAPDGRMFLALDSDLAHDVDPLILYDAYHPSRSIAVYDWANDTKPAEIMSESSRITGLDYADGSLYVSRAGEVGRIPDGGSYETLANGFSVSSQLFHANNGIVINNGAAGMPNFAGTRFGLATRIGVEPAPAGLRVVYRTRVAGDHHPGGEGDVRLGVDLDRASCRAQNQGARVDRLLPGE